MSDANAIALGQKNEDLTPRDWKELFQKYMGRYLKSHPKTASLGDDWQANYKAMVIYERKIMDAVTLVITELKKKTCLDEFKKQYGISDVDWNLVISLSEDTIFEFKEYLNWTQVSKRQFSDDFIPFVAEYIDWKIMSNRYVSDHIIRKYHKKLDWKLLSQQGISQDIIREFSDKVYWDLLPAQHYTEDFMIEFYDNLKKYIGYAPENKDFFKKVGWKNINWDTIKTNNLDDKFVRKKADKINWELNREDLSRRCWDVEFINEYADNFIWELLPVAHLNDAKFINQYRKRINWDALSYELRSERFIDVFHEYVVWENIPAKKFSDNFVLKHCEELYWPNVIIDHLDEETLDKCDQKLKKYKGDRKNAHRQLAWSRISRKPELSEEFIQKHQDKVDWDVIAHRKDLSKKFRKKFDKQIQPFMRDVHQAMGKTEQEYTKKLMDPNQQKFMGNYR